MLHTLYNFISGQMLILLDVRREKWEDWQLFSNKLFSGWPTGEKRTSLRMLPTTFVYAQTNSFEVWLILI